VKAGDPQRQQGAGWLFVAPAIVIIGLFVILPIGMALWVSLSDWGGRGSPFSSDVNFVGTDNYSALLVEPGLARQDLMISFRNTFYYVIGVVPLQTILALSRRSRSRCSSCSCLPAAARSTACWAGSGSTVPTGLPTPGD
jgi:multiple sugar transport system permease protein